jgi:EAL domain-containing protein (putative c-di-GMP-specific phosphodiesterase class I)
MTDVGCAANVFKQLTDMGLSLAIDDFGTGMSSLSYLKRLPVTAIKIDRSFVMDMAEDGENAVIVRSIVDLAHNLGYRVIAEGVETEEVLNLLISLGCDSAQGYYFSEPITTPAFEAWLKSYHSDSATPSDNRHTILGAVNDEIPVAG